jgi:hypothetical protein
MTYLKTILKRLHIPTIWWRERNLIKSLMVDKLKVFSHQLSMCMKLSTLPHIQFLPFPQAWLKIIRGTLFWLETVKKQQPRICWFQEKTGTWCLHALLNHRESEALKTHNFIHSVPCLSKTLREQCSLKAFKNSLKLKKLMRGHHRRNDLEKTKYLKENSINISLKTWCLKFCQKHSILIQIFLRVIIRGLINFSLYYTTK